METTDVLLDALCRAAFAPQSMMMMDQNGQPAVMDQPSPLVLTMASMMQRAFAEDPAVRALVLAELTKPETVQQLAGEIAKGVGRMRVNSASSWNRAADVPEWVNDALTASLVDWLGTDAAADLIPKMLERGSIKITVERKDANENAR